jgi:hypothetical protein
MERRILQYEKPFDRRQQLMPALSLVFTRLDVRSLFSYTKIEYCS